MAEESSYRALRVEHGENNVAEIVLTGPGKGNAMGPDFWRELPLAVATLEADEGVRAVIVRGDGKHFSYGLDLGAMVGELPVAGEQLAAERTRFLDTILRMQKAVTSVATCRKPVIAAISGWCIGGGTGSDRGVRHPALLGGSALQSARDEDGDCGGHWEPATPAAHHRRGKHARAGSHWQGHRRRARAAHGAGERGLRVAGSAALRRTGDGRARSRRTRHWSCRGRSVC